MDLGIAGTEQLEEIGRGGFAVVYKAWQPAFERNVAIKVLTTNVDELAAQRFERECSAIGALSGHPNIVTVYDVGKTKDERPYIMMEFLAEGSLADLVRRDGALSWEDAVTIGIKLSGALESAHRISVLHRDVKPENVLISRYGEPKLADFGIARIEGKAETRSGLITASPHHAPPEILNGKRASVAADIYSLASTIFSLVAGHGPFDREDDDTVFAIYARIANEPIPNMTEFGVPAPAARVLERALSKEPDDRPQSAADFGSLLQEAQLECGLTPTPLPVELSREPGAAGGTGSRFGATGSPTQPRTGAAAAPPAGRGMTSMEERQRRMKRSFVLTGAVALVLIVGIVVLLAVNSGGGSRSNATTATTLAKAPGEVRDDFSNPASGWQQANDASGARRYENGHFHIESIRQGLVSLSFPGNAPVVAASETDVSAVVAPDTNGTGIYGLACRYQNTNGRSFYFATVSPIGEWAIYRAGSTDAAAAVLSQGSVALTAGAHRLGLNCSGSPLGLQLSLDGRQIGGAADGAPLPIGRSGLVVLSLGTQPFGVDFDDFVFKPLP